MAKKNTTKSIDDFEIDLEGTDTSMPRMAAGVYGFIISDAEIKHNKDETGFNMVVKFASLEPSKSVEGDTLREGFTVMKYFPLQQSPNPDAPDFKKDIVFLFAAAYGVSVDEAKHLKINQATVVGMKGHELSAKVAVEDKNDGYGIQNRIGSFKSL